MFNAELYTSQHARAQDIIYVRATQGLAKFVGREILYVDVFAHFEWRARTGQLTGKASIPEYICMYIFDQNP